ncbi:uncharacterized protein [Triticum aestivum]|uniref:uncharacterized protein n=1 Tax=Triticum aestivum TaxID=4565 RepID=UPI001D02FADF|nr:uncharacterized protein LOC123081539 [Triticum aestivum]
MVSAVPVAGLSLQVNKRRRGVVVGSFGASVLPDELTTEVLLQLPVKSILRFRAVCRFWASALSSEEFCSLHMAKVEAAPPKLIFISPSVTFDSTGVYSSSFPTDCPLFTLNDVCGDFAALTPSPCRGLTLLHDELAPAYYVFNAATRAVTRLPPCQHAIFSTTGLGALCRRPRAVVLSFSLNYETFGWVPSPPFEIPRRGVHLVELGERLCMVRDLHPQDNNMLEIWNYSSSDWSLQHSIDLSHNVAGDLISSAQVIRVIGSVRDCGSTDKVILATSKHKMITYDPSSGILEAIDGTRETSLYEADEQSAPRFSLFKESLAPVHKTNQETALSTPLAMAIKEVLLRLPGDYVAQFKLVCKQWLSLIESGGFIRSFHVHNNVDKRPKVMFVGKGTGGLGFSFAPSKRLLRQGAWLDRKVVCSKPCHGLNLVSCEIEDYLYNPCTSYHLTYPAIVPPHRVPRHVLAMMHGNVCTPEDHTFAVGNKNSGLGFNLLTQEHVVVQIFYHLKDFKSRQYFLTCSVIDLTSAQDHHEPPLPLNGMPPAYLSGALYWMSEPRLGQSYERAIVSLNVANERFGVIPCPSSIAMWSDTSPNQAFVVELEGILCVVLADPVAQEIDIWKLEQDQCDRAYKIYLEGCPGYSPAENVVVPLIIDPKDGRILLDTGRKMGLYDPVRRTIENLYDLDEVLRVTLLS